MKDEPGAINCREKLVPKWIAILVAVVCVTGLFFIPPSSYAFYLWIALSGLFILKTFTQKPDLHPSLIIGNHGVRLSDSAFYPYSEIEKVMAFSKNKLRFRSVSFRLYLKDGRKVEFNVDNLDVKPQKLLDAINANLNI
jgi:hypothetical protein